MKVRVSAVSYLNTLPFIHGINQSDLRNEIDLSLDIPSDCAQKLLNDEVDLGLVPIAVIPQLKEHYIISDYCIGAEGKVDTVALYSDVPLEEITHVYLDFHSKTSINLVQVLAREYWEISPNWMDAGKEFIQEIGGKTAGVIIGDRTFALPKSFNYKYDLAEEWKKMTGLPFVFACWVANKKLPQSFIDNFDKALSIGVNAIEDVIESKDKRAITKKELSNYLTHNIDYNLTNDKLKALSKFLDYIKANEISNTFS
ncbi:MAG: menaquinone biosynthesis protein [Vicingaceae bacterium]|nr:menaquinone biosynthesis protein [Vicingaceae bacterium]